GRLRHCLLCGKLRIQLGKSGADRLGNRRQGALSQHSLVTTLDVVNFYVSPDVRRPDLRRDRLFLDSSKQHQLSIEYRAREGTVQSHVVLQYFDHVGEGFLVEYGERAAFATQVPG